ncbi:MAG: 16S rRNA (guanine(527)-N(7))-methyltransferase RsmG [Cyclobacteriaceae bacterium]|nr:16S rRNA (guanine(527)-N(7))-methyltransferase RsmG [Cyclobacteriaceae bacterium]
MKVEEIFHYFPQLTKAQQTQLMDMETIYREWNDKINVISRKDIDHLYERHVLHSLAIAKVIDFKPGSDVLDVGTGGGFPGIPLAILFPDTHFDLVDSIGKKIRVVSEVVQHLNLQNVEAHHCRAEEVKKKFDFVVSRAVTRMDKFIPFVHRKFKSQSNHPIKNGILYLKGGGMQPEEKESPFAYHKFPISDFFGEDFFDTKYVVHIPI